MSLEKLTQRCESRSSGILDLRVPRELGEVIFEWEDVVESKEEKWREFRFCLAK